MKEDLLKKLIASIKCGSCGQYYDESHIEVIERSDELWFLKVVCSSCHVHCMVAAIIREDNQPKIITDLTEKELDKFKNKDNVGDEDLLEMHDFLKDFDGDFPRIFRQNE
jgi:hypothetical protein